MLRNQPVLYLEFLEDTVRYLVMHPTNQTIVERGEWFFETPLFGEGQLLQSTALENRLRSFAQEKRWRKAKVSLLLPNEYVIIREEKIPSLLKPNEIRKYLTLQLKQTIRTPFKETTFRFKTLEVDEKERKLLLVMYPKPLIQQLQETLEKVNFVPMVADVAALSLYRLVMDQYGDTPLATQIPLVLQWNRTSYTITIFKDHVPNMFRHSPLGTHLLGWEKDEAADAWVWTHSNVQYEESVNEVLDMLERFLEFYRYTVLSGVNGVNTIYLATEMPNEEDLRERLATRFEIPVYEIIAQEQAVRNCDLPLFGLTLKTKYAKGNLKEAIKELGEDV